ncbi:MAG: LysR family transcriptional regulator, low CO2-responsive transcriptional regulator [Kribbellaceae bacterium]|nr:LysR family transcriptional regulator, low CO2-responsive transcriptional regulator [Kribbellaceae bacterium]
MTPTQLRAFSAVVRLGSVKAAAVELHVTEAAVSLHVGHLRKELGDKLFNRTASGLAFTPGGLRLASRAAELLGLQDRTILEVSQAGRGRRLMRIAASTLFAEYAAPGLIELFADRADDLDVELSVHHPRDFAALLADRVVDVALGPVPAGLPESLRRVAFLNYRIVVVAGANHPAAIVPPRLSQLREQTWLLGPSAVTDGAVSSLLQRLDIPEGHQRIFQSHAAAIEEAKRDNGIAVALSSAASGDVSSGRLKVLNGRGLTAGGVWNAMTLASHAVVPAAAELTRFITTPRAIQAMLRGSGVNVGHFRPSIHVTLWS